MNKSTQPSSKPLRGIAALFDDFERKELFRKYVFFLGWVEVLILGVCWLYQLGDGTSDHLGKVDIPFPWKAYFLISFLTPVAITFIIGVVVVGFNKYFGEVEPAGEQTAQTESAESGEDKSSRVYKLSKIVNWLQRLPFLALLLLLSVGSVFVYNLDTFLAFIANVGEKSVKVVLISAAVLVGIASVFAFILIILNYQLRKKSMAYQYKSDMAERFGLIILDDNTVLNKDGKLLIQGKNWKETVPLLPATTTGTDPQESSATTIRRPVDVEA